MDKPFSAYRGAEPFVFVCYAHEDSAVVYPELDWLHAQGVKIWYDEGIAAGKNWRAEIGHSLLNAERVLFYISSRALASDHCNREINLALDEGKEVIPVYLEEVALTADLKVGLSRVQALRRVDDVRYRRELLTGLTGASLKAEPALPVAGPAGRWRWLLGAALAASGIVAVVILKPGSGPSELETMPQNVSAAQTRPPPVAAEVDARPSVVVLPFVNMSSDPEQEYFSDGLAEELINLLTRNPELKIISRSSAFAFKNKDVSIDYVSQQLGAGHVLEGSVRKSGNMLRITALLTEVKSGTHLWSESFDRPLDDVFAIQDEIAASVAERLNVTLLEGDVREREVSPEAYQSYLRARHFLGLAGDVESVLEAERLLNAALALNPQYVQALTELARLQSHKADWGLIEPDAADSLASSLILRALEIDSEDPVANAWHGWNLLYSGDDPEQAARYYERALMLEPNNPDILRSLVPVLTTFTQHERALALAEYVVDLDPLCVICIGNLASGYLSAGRDAEAATQFRQALALSPDAIGPRSQLGLLLLRRGEVAEALAVIGKLDPDSSVAQALQVCASYAQGHTDEFRTVFAEFRRRWPEERHLIAGLYAWSDDPDQAFSLLHDQAATYRGLQDLPFGMPAPPLWRAYLDDPRWHAYLEMIGYVPERFSSIGFDPVLPPGARP